MTNILGISALYHDSAAALVTDGRIVAAVQEERFSRTKHDPTMPLRAIESCLEAGGLGPDDLDMVVYYEKPLTKFVRILRTNFALGPRGFRSFNQAMPVWLKQKLWVAYEIEKGLRSLGYRMPRKELYFTEHHESHAASAFFPSPFESAAILTFDGVGEWATSSMGRGTGNTIKLERQLDYPDSLGLLYSAFTAYCGFRVNSGEYKLMGLAPYGTPRFTDVILDTLVDLGDDGSFTLDQKYFSYLEAKRMYSKRFEQLFGGPGRTPEGPITERECDLAASIQAVTEEIVLRIAATAATLTGERRAVLAGGVALNCVANGRLLRDGPFDEVWVQPAAGDAGGALGAALYGWYQIHGGERSVDGKHDSMEGAFLGPEPLPGGIDTWPEAEALPHHALTAADRAERIADLLADGKVVAVAQGRMEFGPRSLGNRSILADPRDPETQTQLNLKIKYRESFRPFAPAVLAERADEWFDLAGVESPYMMLTTTLAKERRLDAGANPADLRDWVSQVRSEIPAVTHVDWSARVQTVDVDRNPRFHAILSAFEARTGCPVLVNTSFNVRGEPIVNTAQDAYRCFMRTDIDALVVDDLLFLKDEQPGIVDRPLAQELVLD